MQERLWVKDLWKIHSNLMKKTAKNNKKSQFFYRLYNINKNLKNCLVNYDMALKIEMVYHRFNQSIRCIEHLYEK